MNNFAVIDVETDNIQDGKIPKTKFWGYADSKGYEYFKTTAQLSKFLRRERKDYTLLHHAPFDILQALVDGERLQIVRSHNNRIIECRWNEHRTINTHSCFPVPLKKNENHAAGIFEAFGYTGTGLGNLRKRNYEDCVNGLNCFLKLDAIFFDLVGVSPLEKGTIAGTGFAAAEKIAGRMPKDLGFLEAYRGGKVEVYDLNYHGKVDSTYKAFLKRYIQQNSIFDKKGNMLEKREFPYGRVKKDASKFDICSSYPASFIDAPDRGTLINAGVICHDWYAPFFDEFENDMHSLLFPNGKFSTWFYADVFEKYIEPFMTNTVIKKIISKTKIDLTWLKRLEFFIRDIYAKKNASEGAVKLACKLLVNATYGRIGLRGDGERARFIDKLGNHEGAYKVGKRWLVFDSIEREPRSNFPMAAYITDSARGRLYKGSVQNKSIYGDTDAVVTKNSEKTFKGETGNELGDFKYEGTECFCARNVKDYIWGKKTILKGGSNYMNWTLKRLAKGQTAVAVSRSRKTELRKRIVHKDGTTSPLIVP